MKKIIYISLIIFTLQSCGYVNKSDIETSTATVEENANVVKVSKAQFKTMEMSIAPIDYNCFNKSVSASGMVDVPIQNKANINSLVDGYVKTISVQAGDHINKGQMLMSIESPEYLKIQQEYLEVKAQINYLKSEYDRQLTLFKENITSQKKYLEAESNYKIVKAQLEGLKGRLRQLNANITAIDNGNISSILTIYAPISGDVANINTNIGSSVSNSEQLIQVINSSVKILNLSVFEKDILDIREGQIIEFYTSQDKSHKFAAKLKQVGKSIQGSDRVVSVLANLSDSIQDKFIVGMMVDANIITSERDFLSILKDAVIKEDGRYYVLVLNSQNPEEYLFDKLEIQIGNSSDSMLEIVPNEAVKEETQILMKGTYDVS